MAPNQAQTTEGVPAPTERNLQALVAPQHSSRKQKRQLASMAWAPAVTGPSPPHVAPPGVPPTPAHLSPVAPDPPGTRGGVTAPTASARLQRSRGKKRWVAGAPAPPGPSLPHGPPVTAPLVLGHLSPVSADQPQASVGAPAATARASLEALFGPQQIPRRLQGRLGTRQQAAGSGSGPGSQVGVEDAAMDMEVPAVPDPAQMVWPQPQPGSQVGVEDAAMDTELPALPNPAQTVWPQSQPGSQARVEDAAMDMEAPAVPNPAQMLWPPSQPGSQVGVEDAAMDTEAPAVPNPAQMLWPQSQPGSMAGGLGQTAYIQSGSITASFSAGGGFGASSPHQGVGSAQLPAVQSAGFAGTPAGFSPSGPIRPRAVRASFQMPPSPLHPPLPVATAQGPIFGSMLSPAAAGGFQPCGPSPWQPIMAGSGYVAAAVGAGTASSLPGGLTTPAAGPGSRAAGPGFTAAGPGFTAAGPGLGAAGPAGQPAPSPLSPPGLAPGILAGASAQPPGPAGCSAQGERPGKQSLSEAGARIMARAQAAWASGEWLKKTAAHGVPRAARGSSQAAGQGSGTADGSSQAAGGAPGAAPGSMQAAPGQPSHHQHSPVSALGSSGDQALRVLPLRPLQTTVALGQAAAGLSAGPPGTGALVVPACQVHVPAAGRPCMQSACRLQSCR